MPVGTLPWEAPYLPIDPKDVGRTYEAVIRVNSQSGKGGVAYILKAEHKLDLPRRAQIEFSRVVQERTDAEGGEMTPEAIWTVFCAEYLNRETPLKLNSVHTSSAAGEKDALDVNVYVDGEIQSLHGEGNGPIAAFVTAINELPHRLGRPGARLRRARPLRRWRRAGRGVRRVPGPRPGLLGRRRGREHRHRLAQGGDQRGQPSGERRLGSAVRNLAPPGVVGRTCGVRRRDCSGSSRTGALVATLTPSAVADDPGSRPTRAARAGDAYGTVWNILPPGSEGNVTALDVAGLGGSTTATPTSPSNVADQLEMYDALTKRDPGSIDER